MKLFKYITIALSSFFMCGCSDYLDNAPDVDNGNGFQ